MIAAAPPLARPVDIPGRVHHAEALGDVLLDAAYAGDVFVGWAAPATGKTRGDPSPGYSVYNGDAGIALALAHLYKATGTESYRRAARHALNGCIESFATLTPFSYYAGRLGVVLTVLEVADLIADRHLQERGEALAGLLYAEEALDVQADLIAGAAGAIPGLIRLSRLVPDSRATTLIHLLRHRVLNSAIRLQEGWAWETVPSARKPLTGYAHGGSGFAVALAELAVFAGDEYCAFGALRAMAYEDHHFLDKQNNWPDLRLTAVSMSAGASSRRHLVPEMTAWCHGAPGIGLARLRCDQLIGHRGRPDAINVALAKTLQSVGHCHPRVSDCLCHGWMGNLLIARILSAYVDDDQQRAICDRALIERLEAHHHRPWRCDGPEGSALAEPDYSLFTGKAGVLLSLLTYGGDPHTTLLPSSGTFGDQENRDAIADAALKLERAERQSHYATSRAILGSNTQAGASTNHMLEGPRARRIALRVAGSGKGAVGVLRGRAQEALTGFVDDLAAHRLRSRQAWRFPDIAFATTDDVKTGRRFELTPWLLTSVTGDDILSLEPSAAQLMQLAGTSHRMRFALHIQGATDVHVRQLQFFGLLTLSSIRRPTTLRGVTERVANRFPFAQRRRARELATLQLLEASNAGYLVLDKRHPYGESR